MSEREAQMKFPDHRNGLQRIAGYYTEIVKGEEGVRDREVKLPIRIYVGPRKAARA